MTEVQGAVCLLGPRRRGAVRPQCSTSLRSHSLVRPCRRTGAGKVPFFDRSHGVLGDDHPNNSETSLAVKRSPNPIANTSRLAATTSPSSSDPDSTECADHQDATSPRAHSCTSPCSPLTTAGAGKPWWPATSDLTSKAETPRKIAISCRLRRSFTRIERSPSPTIAKHARRHCDAATRPPRCFDSSTRPPSMSAHVVSAAMRRHVLCITAADQTAMEAHASRRRSRRTLTWRTVRACVGTSGAIRILGRICRIASSRRPLRVRTAQSKPAQLLKRVARVSRRRVGPMRGGEYERSE